MSVALLQRRRRDQATLPLLRVSGGAARHAEGESTPRPGFGLSREFRFLLQPPAPPPVPTPAAEVTRLLPSSVTVKQTVVAKARGGRPRSRACSGSGSRRRPCVPAPSAPRRGPEAGHRPLLCPPHTSRPSLRRGEGTKDEVRLPHHSLKALPPAERRPRFRRQRALPVPRSRRALSPRRLTRPETYTFSRALPPPGVHAFRGAGCCFGGRAAPRLHEAPQ